MNLNKYLFLLLSFFGLYSPVYAQLQPSPQTVLTPNAAALGQYGQVSVSLFTGRPNIEIPLYTLQNGQNTTALSLSYDASGFRPDEHPGWVGMNWSLQASGVISRKVRDMPDEDDLSTTPNTPQPNGFFYPVVHNILNRNDWASTTFITGLASGVYSPFLGDIDTEPDEFSFHFAGYSGKFYMDAVSGEWKVKCDRPLKIVSNQSPAPNASYFADIPLYQPRGGGSNTYLRGFYGFTVTGEDGTQYVFGNTTDAVEYSIPYFSQAQSCWVANSWYLTKTISTGGQITTYTYAREAGTYINQMYISCTVLYSMYTYDPGSGIYSTTGTCSSTYSTNKTNPYFWYQGQLISPVYLTTIQTTNATIRFERSTTKELRYLQDLYRHKRCIWLGDESICDESNRAGESFLPILEDNPASETYPDCLEKLQWKKLDRIRIERPSGELIKAFVFKYSDNPDNAANRAQQRLTLLSVAEIGANGQTKPPYQFNYYHLQNNLPLPEYGANMTDHWGYFNNAYSTIGGANYYNEKNPTTDLTVYKRGLLTEIKYPTGGRTEFDYEQHYYSKQLDVVRWNPLVSLTTDQPAGGVRVKKVSSFSTSTSTTPVTKEYEYTASSSRSSGILGGRIQYLYNRYKMKMQQTSALLAWDIFSAQSILPACNNANGSHVGYSEVIEKRSDGGFTRYFFSNFDNTHTIDGVTKARLDDGPVGSILESSSPYDMFSSMDEDRGKLWKEEVYNAAGTKLQMREIEYTPLNKATPGHEEFVRAVVAGNIQPCPSGGYAVAATAYKNYTYSYVPVKETTTTFDATGTGNNTTTTEYTDQRLVRSKTTTDSKGSSLGTAYKYPSDFTFPGVPTANSEAGAIKAMGAQEKHMLAFPIETLTLRGGSVISAAVSTYKASGLTSAIIRPYKTYQLETAAPLQLDVASGMTRYTRLQFGTSNPILDQHLTLRNTATAYDSQGYPLSIAQSDGLTTSYVWGYNNTLPLAEVTNAAWDRVFHTGFEASGAGGWSYSTSNVVANAARTGEQGYLLNAASGTGITRSNLPTDEDFVLSFWARPLAPATVAPGVVLTSGSTSVAVLRSSISAMDTQGWQLHRYYIRFTSITSSVTINTAAGNSLYVDELRLHPVGALMKTYTHDPAAGTTSITDVNCQPQLYQYDEFQRLKLIKDSQGSITKHFEYHYQQ